MMLGQETGLIMAVAGMVSVGGRCHTFDMRADGFARGEGCCMSVLQRPNAHSSHDGTSGERRLLSMAGSAVQQDGRSASLTAPSGHAQQAVMHAAHDDACITPDTLSINEAHGTGTPLGDPIEAGSLAAVLSKRRTLEQLALCGIKVTIRPVHSERSGSASCPS